MLLWYVWTLLACSLPIHARHFNGGTIRWFPLVPDDNSSTVNITITQSYAWVYPTINCAADVPISTAGRERENRNLSCVVDCATDGGYSTQTIDTLTDCTFASSPLGMMTSERSHNVTLNASAHFYLAHVGSAWVGLNYPKQNNLDWSIVTRIDLRMRPDGVINTPPVASVVSPQYAIVNRTTEIDIPVSDVNAGDDVRCRWASYTPGYRRRRRQSEDVHERQKRACGSGCQIGNRCTQSQCHGTSCTGKRCTQSCCEYLSTKPIVPSNETTTTEPVGTVRSTLSYANQQAIDECGGICFPDSLPNGTTLSNCTITFTGLRADTWYAVAVQVEDFIDENSTTAMSSVPVQLLIYVMPEPVCQNVPIILPVTSCLEVQVDVPMTFDLYVASRCNASVSTVTDVLVVNAISGMLDDDLVVSPRNSSLSYVTYTWTPQDNQIGLQEMCVVAYTSEKVQSEQACITFIVKNSSNLCVTTTTTTTTTTRTTTTATTRTTRTTVTTTTTTTTRTTTTAAVTENPINWPLILGLSLMGLLLALCSCFCCAYWLLWSPAARRRQQKRAYGEGSQKPRPSSQPLEAFVPSKEVFARRVSYSKVILETTNEEQPDKPIASVRRSSVTVLPLNRVVPLHEADETQESVGAQKMGDGPIAGRRGSIMLDSRPRAMSFDPTSGRRPSISSIQLQPTVLSSRRGSLVPSNQPSTGNGVVVTYLPRRGSIAQTNQP